MPPSSTPPGHIKLTLPTMFVAGLLVSLAAWTFNEWRTSEASILRLQIEVGAHKEAADRAYGLAASCQSRLDVLERKVERVREQLR